MGRVAQVVLSPWYVPPPEVHASLLTKSVQPLEAIPPQQAPRFTVQLLTCNVPPVEVETASPETVTPLNVSPKLALCPARPVPAGSLGPSTVSAWFEIARNCAVPVPPAGTDPPRPAEIGL